MALGLKAARETVDSAAAKVVESAGTIERAIAVSIGIAVGAFLVACVAILIAVSGRKVTA